MQLSERELYEREKAIQKQRQFLGAIEPILRYKSHIANIAMPSITIYPDGRVDRVYPAWAQEYFEQCDKIIAYIAERHEFKLPEA